MFRITSYPAEFSLLSYGDVQTLNYLNELPDGGYENINQLIPMKRIDESTLSSVSLLTANENPAERDLISALVVGLDVLVRTNSNYKFNRVIVLVTDGESLMQDLDDLDPVLSTMQGNTCSTYILMLGKVNATSSSNKVATSTVLKRIVSVTGGRYVEADDLSDCWSLLASAPGLCSRPRQTKISFELSPYVKIPCVHSNKCKNVPLPSLKKVGGNSGSTVKREITYRNPLEEEEEVLYDERIKGYRYGAQYIPINGEIN